MKISYKKYDPHDKYKYLDATDSHISKFFGIIIFCVIMAVGYALFGNNVKTENEKNIEASNETQTYDPASVSWYQEKEVVQTIEDYTFHGYLSEDGKLCWLYLIDIKEGSHSQTLSIPTYLNDAKVIYIGSPATDPTVEHEYEFENNIFGNMVETWHDSSGYTKNMKYIKHLILPDSVVEIGAFSFSGLEYLKDVTFPSGLKRLDILSFYGCKRLKSADLPENMEYVSVDAFEKCSKLDYETDSEIVAVSLIQDSIEINMGMQSDLSAVAEYDNGDKKYFDKEQLKEINAKWFYESTNESFEVTEDGTIKTISEGNGTVWVEILDGKIVSPRTEIIVKGYWN